MALHQLRTVCGLAMPRTYTLTPRVPTGALGVMSVAQGDGCPSNARIVHPMSLFQHTPCMIDTRESRTYTVLTAMIDSGSSVNLIRTNTYNKLQLARQTCKLPPLTLDTTVARCVLVGVNNSSFTPRGRMPLVLSPRRSSTAHYVFGCR